MDRSRHTALDALPPHNASLGERIQQPPHNPLDLASWALRRNDLQSALIQGETPELYEALGEVGYWTGDAELTLNSRERAYHLYQHQGDRAGAARLAIALGSDYFYFRSAASVSNGWFQHAIRILENLPIAPEHGWLDFHRADVRFFGFGDNVGALALASNADAIARLLGLEELSICAQSMRGLALVTLGRVAEGMAALDGSAVAALADHSLNVDLLNSVSCNLLQACNLARDFERSTEWCERILESLQDREQEFAFCFCRPAYAFALTRQGKWERADAELQSAIRDLNLIRPALLTETHIRLAELRCLQGAWEESAELFHRSEADSLSLNGRAILALAHGENDSAEQLADRYLRKLTPRLRLERMQPLEILLAAQVNQGNLAGAEGTLIEIEELARIVDTTPMRAAAATARGRVLAVAGKMREAAANLEDAVDYFQQCPLPYEVAVAKLELARAQITLGREREARSELMDAITGLQMLGAHADAERARRALEMLELPPQNSTVIPSRTHNPNQLSPRECEVVALIATGKSNQEIADLLVLSPRTVERHISTIYEKLGLRGKAARAAATAWALRQGIAH